MTRARQVSRTPLRAEVPKSAAIALLVLAAGCAAAGARPGSDPAQRGLWIGSLHLCRDTVEGANASADTIGMPVLHMTLRPELRDGLRRETEERVGQTLPVRLNGRTVSAPIVREPIAGGEISLSGASRQEVEALRAASLGPC